MSGAVSFLCVVCVAKVGVRRAEWAAIYRGDQGYCPEHLESISGEPSRDLPEWCHDCQSRHPPRARTQPI